MNIQISPEAEHLIRELVERGDYDDPEAIVDEALAASPSGINSRD